MTSTALLDFLVDKFQTTVDFLDRFSYGSGLRSKICCFRRTTRTKFGPREKWGKSKKVERAGWGWGKKVTFPFSLPHPPPSIFLLSPHFSCSPNAKKTLSRGPNFVRVVRERLLRRLGVSL